MKQEHSKFILQYKQKHPKEGYKTIARLVEDKFGVEISPNDIKNLIKMEDQQIVYLNKRSTADINEIWEETINFQKKLQEQTNDQKELVLKINSSVPIGIVFSSDWHIGNIGTDYQQLLSDISFIRNSKNTYVITIGDEFDNYIASAPDGGKFEALVQPETQRELAMDLYNQISNKVLAVVRSCHTSWSREQDDFDFSRYVAKTLGCANLGYGGKIEIKLGKQSYTIGVKHKWGGNSATTKRMAGLAKYELQQGFVDILATAHYHEPFAASTRFMNKNCYILASGSYKIRDRYGEKIGDYGGVPGAVMAVISPDEKKIVCFTDIRMGVSYLDNIT